MGSLFEGPQIASPQLNQSLSRLPSQVNTSVGNINPVNVNAGGFQSSFNNGSLTLNTTAQRQGLVNNLAQTSLNQAGLVAGLRGQVTDGVSGLRASRIAENENRRRASVSNLKDNLARRRVLGSSFGADAVTRSELQFAQEADRIEAESFLQELDLNNRLIQQEFDLRRNSFETRLNEFNLQADFAAQLNQEVTKVLQSGAQFRTQLEAVKAEQAATGAIQQTRIGIEQAKQDAAASAGTGSFFGKLIGTAAGPILSRLGGAALAPATGGASLGLSF